MTREQAIRKVALLASLSPGDKVTVRSNRERFSLLSAKNYLGHKPEPTDRTQVLLRKYNLFDRYDNEPEMVIEWLEQLVAGKPTMDEVHALAEIAEIEASWLAKRGNSDQAMNYFAIALEHAYQFLFSHRLDINRNAYDPQFRSICDIYNRSLEGILRQAFAQGDFSPNNKIQVGSGASGFELTVEVAGRWQDQEFERIEMVNDYDTEGLENRYHTYGLGVPLIAVRKQQQQTRPDEKYYPPELSLPMTAFCIFMDAIDAADEATARATELATEKSPEASPRRAVLTLYDPLERTTVTANSHVVPLESDITTPLAYQLRDPVVNSGVLATASLLNAELHPNIYGMYMLEPYDPEKIPVVMVHGLWSSPMTWVHMFNDLRANPEIHEHYQFWFYSYPSGQPIWMSARQMRSDLDQVRNELDPDRKSPSLDQIILVGHSMGGLVSTMQTMDSGEHFWNQVSVDPITDFDGEEESLEQLRETFFFQPNRSIRRVITIASPFQGSDFASESLRWMGKKIFTLPEAETQRMKKIAQQNRKRLIDPEYLGSATSLDSLAPGSKVLEAMDQADVAPDVKFHCIYGRVSKRKLLSLGGDPVFVSDGVVSIESARHRRAISELAVADEHSKVHQNSACIFEIRRILMENLVELDRAQDRTIPDLPFDTDTNDFSPPTKVGQRRERLRRE